ncbi:CotH kinase family protein [Myxococcota bacterium]|nr:CotH kinase family protein [Myxococcota bacterium]
MPDAGDPTEAFFDRDHLVRIEIELAPADWEVLRAQTRTLSTTLARPECLDAPWESPFTYFPATVKIDGVEYGNVGVRKKGFLGSLSETKPSLKIKLDEYRSGLDHLGLTSITLNNGNQDQTLVKPCIAFDVFAAAGLPSSRCNYAEVIVNGQPLGPYVNVEGIGKRFLRRHFPDDEGQLYEGTLSDFREGWLGTFEQETNEDVPYDRSDLQGLTNALTASDATLLDALDPWVDVDRFTRFWATEVLVDHWDGYTGNTNNFYVYRDPATGRFEFFPWGVDGVLGSGNTPEIKSIYATSALPYRLYLHPEGRAQYIAELYRLLSEVWDAEALVREVDRAAAVIAPAVLAEDRRRVARTTELLKTWIREREGAIRAELDAGGIDWTTPLRDPICFEEATFTASLSTTFGTHPAPNIFASGSGTFTATIAGTPTAGVNVGASSGFGTNPDDMNDAVLALAATTAAGPIPIVYVAMDPELLTPGVVPIDGQRARSALLQIPRPGAEIEYLGFVFSGWMSITAGAAEPGAPVEATIQGYVLMPRTP